jgi:hypothetical protein
MNFLPIENITYRTKLSENEVIQKLHESVKRKDNSDSRYNKRINKPYEGHINGRTFEINKVAIPRNSFLPRITGKINAGTDETLINVKMQLRYSLIGFLVVWCFVILAIFTIVLAKTDWNSEFQPATLIPLIMLILAYVLAVCGFKQESTKAKEDLRRIFEANKFVETN